MNRQECFEGTRAGGAAGQLRYDRRRPKAISGDRPYAITDTNQHLIACFESSRIEVAARFETLLLGFDGGQNLVTMMSKRRRDVAIGEHQTQTRYTAQ